MYFIEAQIDAYCITTLIALTSFRDTNNNLDTILATKQYMKCSPLRKLIVMSILIKISVDVGCHFHRNLLILKSVSNQQIVYFPMPDSIHATTTTTTTTTTINDTINNNDDDDDNDNNYDDNDYDDNNDESNKSA